MNHRGVGGQRLLHVDQRRQRLPLRFDQRQCVLSLHARFGNDRGDGFALPTGALNGHRMLRRRFNALQMPEHSDPRRAIFGNRAAIKNGDYTGLLFRFIKVQRHDFCVCIRAAKKHHVRKPRKLQIIGVRAAALQQSLGVGARNAASDVALGCGRINAHRGRLLGEFSARIHAATLREISTDSIAFTIA